ncbi:EAL domain-containing protein [Qipengyuania sp.]|uniref:EAL domain-containing protein n=1 Tax=Qipengyuania sp. TaxID=2004515 RepID=UPI0035C85697
MTANSCQGCRDGAAFAAPFTMAFQPIVDTETGHIYAYEALVRGSNGESADKILSLVNDQNRYAFDQACRVKAIEKAVAAGLLQTEAKLSINFLPNAVYSPMACIQLTLKTARAQALPLERLVFEFTENEEMASPEHVADIITTYKKFGFTVALDDFGSSYSGLDRLAVLVPDVIKLDRQLLGGIDRDPRRRAIIASMAALGQQLDTRIVAEGIETEAEATTLRELGVRYHQGFWYARPALEQLPGLSNESLAA